MRKLVTVRQIKAVFPIPQADAIEEVQVDGWSVVVQKGLHNVGDLVLYFEIDSFLPESDKRFEPFMKFGTQTFDGVLGHRLRTKRLRGVYSQGIVIPVSDFPEIEKYISDAIRLGGKLEYVLSALNDMCDLAEELGVLKYEAPAERCSGGPNAQKVSTFPWFLRKSDQERIQNLYHKGNTEEVFAPTLKMDGSSITVYAVDAKYDENLLGYCSRNQNIAMSPDNEDSFFRGAVHSDLFTKVAQIKEKHGFSVAIQGELVGPGIQGNFEKFEEYQVFAYRIFNVDTGEYLNYQEFSMLCDTFDIQRVPQVGNPLNVFSLPLQEILALSTGRSIRNKMREGIVWQSLTSPFTFKAISNE
jgi:RNA ligase (TIGR02306 family)